MQLSKHAAPGTHYKCAVCCTDTTKQEPRDLQTALQSHVINVLDSPQHDRRPHHSSWLIAGGAEVLCTCCRMPACVQDHKLAKVEKQQLLLSAAEVEDAPAMWSDLQVLNKLSQLTIT